MTIFNKEIEDKLIDINLSYIQHESSLIDCFYMKVSHKAQKFKTNSFHLNQEGITNIDRTFSIPCSFVILKDKTWRSKYIKLKLIQKQKKHRKLIASWKYDLKNLQNQSSISLKLAPGFNARDLGELCLSVTISKISLQSPQSTDSSPQKGLNSPLQITGSFQSPFIQKVDNSLHSSLPVIAPCVNGIDSIVRLSNSHASLNPSLKGQFNLQLAHSKSLNGQYNLSYDSSAFNYQKNIIKSSSLKGSPNCFSCFNQNKLKIKALCDELVNEDLEKIKSFPNISKKILVEIGTNPSNFESIFFVNKWSETLSLLEQKDNSRKIYGLVATLHLMKILQLKQLLSKEDMNVMIDAFTKLYQLFFDSILENSKLHFENDDMMNEYSFTLLNKFNQIGNGEYCSIISSSLILKMVISVPEEFSDKLCKHLCVSTVEKNKMKAANIDPLTIILQKYTSNDS